MHQHDCQFWKPHFPCNLEHYNLTKCIIDMFLRRRGNSNHRQQKSPEIDKFSSRFRWKIAAGFESDKKFKWSPFINYQKDIKAVSSKWKPPSNIATDLIAHVKRAPTTGIWFASRKNVCSRRNFRFKDEQAFSPSTAHWSRN